MHTSLRLKRTDPDSSALFALFVYSPPAVYSVANLITGIPSSHLISSPGTETTVKTSILLKLVYLSLDLIGLQMSVI